MLTKIKNTFPLISIIILMFAQNSFSQRIKWEEYFETTNIESRGWKIVNNDSSATNVSFFSAFDFFNLGRQNAYKGNYFIKLGFENVNYKDLADDWIISPKLYNILKGDTLSFWCGAIDKLYKDSLKVYISDSDNELSSFSLIDYFKADGPAGSWHKKSYDLSAYKGKNIYFAVNYFLKDAGTLGSSDNVWIDDFTLTGKGYGGVEVNSYELYQNFPNPFNPSTDISVSLPENSDVTIKIYNVSGKEVSTLVNGNYEKGKYSFSFNGSDFSSGVYFYKISAKGVSTEFTDTKKMELIK